VTVIIATKDRRELLAAAISSIATALHDDDELIVVEAGDSGASAALSAVDGPSTVHLAAARAGKSFQLNRAIEQASHEMLLFTDDDARVDADWARAMSAPFTEERVGIAFGPVEGLTQHGDARPSQVGVGDAPITTWTYAHGASMAVRRSAVCGVGGFDERLGPGAPAHGEEHDLLIRVWEHGWRAVVADAPPVAHASWRTAKETDENLLVYERGGGAFLGAALRRHPFRWRKLLVLRAMYQVRLVRASPLGRATLRSFLGGLWYGLRLGEASFLADGRRS